jgi:OOP family OmpA-OmpF porin
MRLLVLGLLGTVLGCTRASQELSSPSPRPEASTVESKSASAALTSAVASSEPSDGDDDGDGLIGEADQCPDMPEDFDGEADEDGCADLACRVDPCEITLLEPVYFKSDKWELDERSHRMLKDVAFVMKFFPSITVEIGGHTDSKASDAHNLDLSERRVDSVMRFLIQVGVEPERMTSRGYGELQPVATNRTALGRASNRRVEVVRTDVSCR